MVRRVILSIPQTDQSTYYIGFFYLFLENGAILGFVNFSPFVVS